MLTESEEHFERFCREQSLAIERVEECEDRRPDYVLRLGTADLYVEVKQIEPASDEKALLAMPVEEWGEDHAYHWGMPGEKVRKKIKAAASQLRSLSAGESPTLLVLYDTIKHWPELLDADAVKVAMYGIETALVSAEAAPSGGAKILARWHGARRQFTREHNRTLSAVAILSDAEMSFTFAVYHNYFAAVPLRVDHLRHPAIQHYKLTTSPEKGFPAWRVV